MSPKTEQVEQTEPLPQSGGGLRIFAWAGLLLVAYVLSIGPAARLDQALKRRHPTASRRLEMLYTPLDALCSYSPQVSRLAGWYVKLWSKP